MTASSLGFFFRGVMIPSDFGSLLTTVAVMLELCHIGPVHRQTNHRSQRQLQHFFRVGILYPDHFNRPWAGWTPAGEHARRGVAGEDAHQRNAACRRYVLAGRIVADVQLAAGDPGREWRERS